MTVRQAWVSAQTQILEKLLLDTAEAKIEAQLLFTTALNVDRAWLIAHESDALLANIHAPFEAMLNRRLNGEPLAYILGHREFYGLTLKVTTATLIPRPDTETLVEAALAKIPTNAACSILDLGTGTGAIALAVAKHRPLSTVTAVDTSSAALDVAKENALTLNISNMRFVLSNWLAELSGSKFDVIVSNPPYIEDKDVHLKQGDLRFEPLTALTSGSDGLDDIRQIIQTAPRHLNPGGWLMLEHGYNQAELVTSLLKNAGFIEIESKADIAGIARVTTGYFSACK
ncbi:MAG TPA: peptide chain release factor N(5)-glutamine methyltransferase [Methylophilaceae bacterium]|nr:peptide chain release factor N(5)-glutamine methyltransferase [Methylophilaceae bacterium]